MKRLLLAPLLLLAALALSCTAFVVDCVSDGWGLGKQVLMTVRDRALEVVTFGLKLFQAEPTGRNPAVRIVQAKAFVARILKRERPVLTSAWRMCPSI